MLGRFFFMHRARAQRDDIRLETYEFLHATFGEFLVARFTAQVLADIVARSTVSAVSFTAAPPDDDLLHALLSFAVLSARASIIGFLTERMTRLADTDRHTQANLLKRLFRVVHEPRPVRHFDRYQPQALPVTARHAAYSANLVLLMACTEDSVQASDLFGTSADAVDEWHRQALLWRSQLGTEDWISLVETLAVDRLLDDHARDLQLSLDDGTFQVPVTDPGWTYDLFPPRSPGGWRSFGYANQAPQSLCRKAHFMCGINDDVIYHALDPLLTTLGETVDLFIEGFDDGLCRSAANALLDVWLLPLRDPGPEERRAVYERCAAIATARVPVPWGISTRGEYGVLLLERLTTDSEATTALAIDILGMFRYPPYPVIEPLAMKIFECVLAFLGRDDDATFVSLR